MMLFERICLESTAAEMRASSREWVVRVFTRGRLPVGSAGLEPADLLEVARCLCWPACCPALASGQ